MKILASNALASIQDLGRFGFRSMGVGTNGAMDPWALQAGNALLKNPVNTAAIEIALGSFSIEFDQVTCFCLTGGSYEAYLDDERVYNYWRIIAKAGQTLKLVRPLQGMYTYLSVQGGFDIDPVLDSLSTNTKAEFGGLNGRFLKQGDIIPLMSSDIAAASLPIIGVAGLSPDLITYDDTKDSFDTDMPTDAYKEITTTLNKATTANQIRVIENSEYNEFSADSKINFEQQFWKIETSSNRMGYRCRGELPLKLTHNINMNSHGVAPGMIQVPPQGHPIVLMADSQTTGGYPKIASVIAADIGLMAQTRFGQLCRFKMISIEEALLALKDRQRYIDRIRRYANDN